ncbi:MAG: type II secretion system F family protein [Candidatus Paceibacterota bacterium]|jgi:type IV pilus assembly protein PilC
MSHFTFKAKKPTGEIYSSEKDAADRYELYKLLREHGDEVVEFKEKTITGGFNFNMKLSIFSHVKTIDKINFARNLGAMLEAGLALSRALSVLERQTKNKVWKEIVTDLIAEIDRGITFADALSKHSKVFPPIFIAMVHAGEQSGTLAESLKVIATQMDSAYSLDKRIKGALMYPAVIVTAMVIIAVLMFIFVIPTLLKTFTDLNVKLPFTTRMVVDVSNIIQNQGLIVLAVLLVFVGFLYWFSLQTKGKIILHALFLKIPVIGGLVQGVNTARTARTLSSLLGSGVDVVESVNITASVVQNVHFRKVLEDAAISIKKGDLVSKTFNEHTDLYPVFFAEMMSVGEETGKTGEMLLGVARYFENDVEQKTKDMSTIIEPFLILLIGAAVGFFAISMIQPMYSLVNVI